MRIRFIFILFCFLIVKTGFTQGFGLITRNSIKARSLGMGGAFTAVEGDLVSLDFNPAAFSVDTRSDKAQVSVFFNPLGPVVLLKNWGENKDWDVPISWILRGATLSLGRINLGLLMGEEAFTLNDQYRKANFFDGVF